MQCWGGELERKCRGNKSRTGRDMEDGARRDQLQSLHKKATRSSVPRSFSTFSLIGRIFISFQLRSYISTTRIPLFFHFPSFLPSCHTFYPPESLLSFFRSFILSSFFAIVLVAYSGQFRSGQVRSDDNPIGQNKI